MAYCSVLRYAPADMYVPLSLSLSFCIRVLLKSSHAVTYSIPPDWYSSTISSVPAVEPYTVVYLPNVDACLYAYHYMVIRSRME